MFIKRFWLPSLIILVSLAGIVLFWVTLQQSLSPQKTTVDSLKNSRNSDEFIGMTIKIPGAEKNGYWELAVNKLESTEDTGHLNKVTGDYFINKELIYQISGNAGEVNWKTRVLKVNGNVILTTADKSKNLTAEEIIWDPGLKKITAQQNVILRTTQGTVDTDELNSNLQLDQMRFNGLTHVVYQRDSHD